jgi:hypothetical protein
MAGEADRHRYYEELAVSHVLGGLSESDGRVFRSHLMDCMDCRARVGELRRIANDLADVERDERRVRAAKAIETKRREDDDEVEADETVPTTRGSRLVLLIGLAVLIGLTAWNFLLRDTNRKLSENIQGATVATNLLIQNPREVRTAFIDSPTHVFSADPNRVLYDDENALIVMDGVEPGKMYAVYLRNKEGGIIDVTTQPAVTRSMTLLVERVDSLYELRVVEPNVFPPSETEVSGTTVLIATLGS